MRFVRLLAAAAALSISTLSSQANAALVFDTGTVTADPSGAFSIPLYFTLSGWRGLINLKTNIPVTSQINMTLQQNNFIRTPRYLPGGSVEKYIGSNIITASTPSQTSTNRSIYYSIGVLNGDGMHPTRYTRFTYSNGTASIFGLTTPGANVDYKIYATVPEPATWALMIMGFGGVGAAVRRRRLKPSAQAISA